jgi:hypothetical protein
MYLVIFPIVFVNEKLASDELDMGSTKTTGLTVLG